MVRDLSRARAILIGNARYESRGIEDLPPARGSVAAMAGLLEGQLCGWPTDRVTQLVDVPTQHELALEVIAAVQDAEDLLVVYYVGHGLRTSKGQLALALGKTHPGSEALPYTAMLYESLAEILRGCRAATKLVILDCCHAELGGKANYVFQGSDLAEAYPVDGLYFIGASKQHEKAKSPVGGELTYFTQALIDVVRGGIANRPEELQLDQIFLELRARLVRANLPEPVESGIRGARQFPFALNAQLIKALPVGAEQERVAEFGRLEDGLLQAGDWYRWGPYVSERQWGTVREDYSADGNAWDYLPHDHARSRAYRWGEDGLAGFCDIHQRLCLALALWNGSDPILKERAFGLTGSQGNHGEDVKEYWWYLDAIPSHAWNRWRYHYPQAAYPYEELIEVNRARNRYQPEYELVDTGIFDADRYWIVEVHYAKAGPDDLLMKILVTNAGPDADTLHVLPTAWFRNTWAWDLDAPKPGMAATGDTSVGIDHPFCGRLELLADSGPDGAKPTTLFCENETNTRRLFGVEPITPYPKDGINDHVVNRASTVNRRRAGTKCAFWYKVTIQPRETVELRLRLRPAARRASRRTADSFGAKFERVVAQRRAEADEFYAELTPAAATADEAMVMRQAFSGMLWSKQFYYYDVARWLDGDPTQAPVPPQRRTGRNSRWRHFDSFDIMSVPDKWEYPWFAAWELGFHCVALAHLDPGFAKYQLILLCREWFQHPNGALPAYEWDFSDVTAPVQAWAALQVFALDGGRDLDFLNRVFDQLLVNFTWWTNREDAEGNNLFDGGFLGLDNIGSVDRSRLPVGSILEQSDATGWMGAYALTMLTIAAILDGSGRRQARGQELKFLQYFAAIRDAINSHGLWDDTDGLYYDRLRTPGGTAMPVKCRSMAGMIPMLPAAVIDEEILGESLAAGKQFAHFLTRQGLSDRDQLLLGGEPGHRGLLLSVAVRQQLEKLFSRLFDESEFLSPHGLRVLSAYHRDHPYTFDVDGTGATIDYEPAESTTAMFGGNANWRGPLWFPLNFLVVSSLERYHQFFGDDFTLEYPSRSGVRLPLDAIAADLQDRLISIFTRGPDGRRPCFGSVERLQTDPAWKDNLLFSEYFHGDNAAGLGASHQTGWTGLVADMIIRRHGGVPAVGNAIHRGLSMQTQR